MFERVWHTAKATLAIAALIAAALISADKLDRQQRLARHPVADPVATGAIADPRPR